VNRAGYRDALARRTVRRLVVAIFFDWSSYSIAVVAIVWLAIDVSATSRSGLAVGLSLGAFGGAGVLGGAIFARRSVSVTPRTLVIAHILVRSGALAVAAALAGLDVLTLPTFVALLAIASVLEAVGTGARRAYIADMMPAGKETTGQALLGFQQNAHYVFAPLIGGVLVDGLGAPVTLSVVALGGLAVAAIVATMPPGSRRTPERGARTFQDTGAGRYVRVMLYATIAFFITYGPVEAALPLLVREEHQASASAYGLLWSAYGASAAVGALIAPVLSRTASKVFAPIILLHGLLVVLMGVATSYSLIALSMFAIGLVYGPYGSLAAAEVQRHTPFHHQTQAHSLWASATMPAIPLGASLGGLLAGAVGVRSAMVASGVSMMAVAVGSAFFLRHPAEGKPPSP
jgi:MFS family permease